MRLLVISTSRFGVDARVRRPASPRRDKIIFALACSSRPVGAVCSATDVRPLRVAPAALLPVTLAEQCCAASETRPYPFPVRDAPPAHPQSRAIAQSAATNVSATARYARSSPNPPPRTRRGEACLARATQGSPLQKLIACSRAAINTADCWRRQPSASAESPPRRESNSPARDFPPAAAPLRLPARAYIACESVVAQLSGYIA